MRCLAPGRKEPPVPRQLTPSQAAGALIPDNTQHSWRDDVRKLQLRLSRVSPRLLR